MSRVQRLRNELSLKLDTGSLVEQDLLKIRDRVGSLVVNALGDEQHPLTEQLSQLTAEIDRYRAIPRALDRSTKKPASPSQDAPKLAVMSNAHYFMPHPGISLPVRRFWPLQLLLHETALSSSREALAERLHMEPQEIPRHAQQAEKVSTDLWSVHQHGTLLRTALGYLDYPEAPLRLDGKLLVYGGQRIRLSRQQIAFVQLLMENAGTWVQHEQFHERKIPNPIRISYAINKKAEGHGINLPIHSQAGAYMLTDVS